MRRQSDLGPVDTGRGLGEPELAQPPLQEVPGLLRALPRARSRRACRAGCGGRSSPMRRLRARRSVMSVCAASDMGAASITGPGEAGWRRSKRCWWVRGTAAATCSAATRCGNPSACASSRWPSPTPARREAFADEHGIPPRRSASPTGASSSPRSRGAPRRDRRDGRHRSTSSPPSRPSRSGYHVLLEKPIAPTPAECLRVVEAAEASGRLLQIGHVLRYTAVLREGARDRR